MKIGQHQQGLATVEFAIIGMIAMVVLFAVFEVARVFFVYNMLEEATRRGARLAAVCAINDPAVREIAINCVWVVVDRINRAVGDPLGICS